MDRQIDKEWKGRGSNSGDGGERREKKRSREDEEWMDTGETSSEKDRIGNGNSSEN